jgi:RNA polymerase sigma factor for flagellar operon FliA
LELEDLVAYGQVGLAEAARDFDPERGNAFSTYAYYRIRGAIYDGLSKMTWLSRSQYGRTRYEQLAGEVLHLESEDNPGEPDIETESRWLRDVSRALAVIYLGTQPGLDEQADRSVDLADPSASEPAAVATEREVSQRLRELIDALPTEAGTLIRAVYFEGLSLQEAGQRLGVSKSWASRLHAKTLKRLARSLSVLGLAF